MCEREREREREERVGVGIGNCPLMKEKGWALLNIGCAGRMGVFGGLS